MVKAVHRVQNERTVPLFRRMLLSFENNGEGFFNTVTGFRPVQSEKNHSTVGIMK